MNLAPLRKPWLAPILALLLAEVSFWYWASTGEDDVDRVAIAFFAFWGLFWIAGWSRRSRIADAVAAAGALASIALMYQALNGKLDFGDVIPYVVFLLFTVAGNLVGGWRQLKPDGAPGKGSIAGPS